MPERLVLEAPAARVALLRGVDMMTALLRPTLGPVARTVAIGRVVGSSPPEVLDSAATIARRTIQLDRPWEDMGAMLVRQLAWKVFEEAGDGTATAAVIAQGITRAAATYIAAGGNPMILKRGIERGLPVALEELRRQARTIELPDEIAGVVAGIVRDPRLAELIGEIMDSVGPDGAVLVEDGQGTDVTHEYIDGTRWNEGYASYFLLKDGANDARLLNPRIFVSDIRLTAAEQVLPVLEACIAAGERTLFLVAPEFGDQVIGLLTVNRQRGVLEDVMAVKAPGVGKQRTRILEDIAAITGGRCLLDEARDRFEDVIIDDLGRARHAWATSYAFGIIGGAGSKGAIRQRIAEAKAELAQTPLDDEYERNKIKERIGKLAGAAAIIRVGAPTSVDRDEQKLRVEAAVTAARAALTEGVVPGGGTAYLAAVPALERLAAGLEGDEAMGVRALAQALAAPMRAIVENAGLDASPLLHEARRHGPGCVFDVLRQEWVNAWDAGIVDPLPVALAALQTSVSTATMALTTEVLVRHKKPEMAKNP